MPITSLGCCSAGASGVSVELGGGKKAPVLIFRFAEETPPGDRLSARLVVAVRGLAPELTAVVVDLA
jgi:hypothetical protein